MVHLASKYQGSEHIESKAPLLMSGLKPGLKPGYFIFVIEVGSSNLNRFILIDLICVTGPTSRTNLLVDSIIQGV